MSDALKQLRRGRRVMMRGYLILELDLPDEPDQSTFPRILEAARDALGEATIARVTHVHAAIGSDGLRESAAYLLGEARP